MFDAPATAPGLHVVATPIGNLGDMTIRGLETLAGADLVLCEDTRQTGKLLDHYSISVRRLSLHEHNERDRVPQILTRLAEGAAIALVSDAGTPLLSDPGFPLVRAARAAGHPVIALPGASALLGALASAGLPTDAFTFAGFLPQKAGQRSAVIEKLKDRSETLVFYESPRRLAKALSALAETLGPDRQAAVALELTKKFERVREGPLGELAARTANEPQKGEAVILVEGAGGSDTPDPDEWREALDAALETLSVRDAVDEISARFGVKRREVYNAALEKRR